MTSLVTSGLLARYACDTGSGTTLVDTSGNGYNGTFAAGGQAPTWHASGWGLTFNGASSQYTTCGSMPIASVKTVQCLCLFSDSSPNVFGAVLCSDSSSGIQWVAGLHTYAAAPITLTPRPFVPTIYSSGTRGAIETPFYRPTPLAWTMDGTLDKIYYDGDLINNYAIANPAVNSASTGRTGNLRIGLAGVGGQALYGTMVYLVTYSTALTRDQISQNALYMREIATARGITTMAGYQNTTSNRNVVGYGDSIMTGANLSNVSYLNTMTTSATWTRYPVSIAGELLEGGAEDSLYNPGNFQRHKSANAPINALVIHAGTNDIQQGRGVEATFTRLRMMVDGALANGWNYVVIIPMLSRTGLDTEKNAYNLLISSYSWPSAVRLVPEASMPHMVPDGSSASTTYFIDQVHPTTTGNNEIAAALASVMDTLTVPSSGSSGYSRSRVVNQAA